MSFILPLSVSAHSPLPPTPPSHPSFTQCCFPSSFRAPLLSLPSVPCPCPALNGPPLPSTPSLAPHILESPSPFFLSFSPFFITQLEPDILECEVKWSLGSITTNKASGGDGIPVELFQILKDDAVKVLHSICQQIWKTQQWPQDWKRSVCIPIPKKGNAKECSNHRTIALISHPSKVMLKIPQARFQQYMNRKLPDVQAAFRKGRGTRDQIANICWIIKKSKRVPEKHLFLLY